VTVGGLVVVVGESDITLDDGTGRARLVLLGDAAPSLELLSIGDAIGATGTVEPGAAEPTITVRQAADLVRLGDLGEALPLGPSEVVATKAPSLVAQGGSEGAADGDPPGVPGGLAASHLAAPGASGIPLPVMIAIGSLAGLALLVAAVTLASNPRRRRSRRQTAGGPDRPAGPPGEAEQVKIAAEIPATAGLPTVPSGTPPDSVPPTA
jgi:hypothetical protein